MQAGDGDSVRFAPERCSFCCSLAEHVLAPFSFLSAEKTVGKVETKEKKELEKAFRYFGFPILLKWFLFSYLWPEHFLLCSSVFNSSSGLGLTKRGHSGVLYCRLILQALTIARLIVWAIKWQRIITTVVGSLERGK